MKVLLISPLRHTDPAGGDVTYTEVLMKNPPPGVIYESYADALRRGALIEHGRRKRFRHEPLLTIGSKIVNFLRKRRVLFWEPHRFFSVKPGEYDLVHLHVFSARFISIDCPLVVSSGAPQRDLYLNYRRYSKTRVAFMEAIEKFLAKSLRVNANSYWMPQAERVIVYTQYYRDYFIRNAYVPAERLQITPIFLQSRSVEITLRPPKRIGFVAYDFNQKGGAVLLEAFRLVRRERPDAELWIVGSCPKMSPEDSCAQGITWVGKVSREALLCEIMPSFDVFAYPTPHDCFSYVMLEAMACGLAIATSDYVSMPEAVNYGQAGLISPVGDAQKLAENILTLLKPEENRHYRLAARARFEEHFSWDAVAPRILSAYESAIAGFRKSLGALHV